jgi:hypothetical protein
MRPDQLLNAGGLVGANRVQPRRLGLRFWAWYWWCAAAGRARGILGLCKHDRGMSCSSADGYRTRCGACRKVMPAAAQMCGTLRR